jgi:nucleobase:cation symporter-1, NCS1 family
MITAIWPSYANVPNTIPESIGITTQGMISYTLYWLVQTPLMLIPTHQLQYLFTAKAIFVTPMALAMTIWIALQAGGSSRDFFNAPSTVSGSTRAWLWLANLVSHSGLAAALWSRVLLSW